MSTLDLTAGPITYTDSGGSGRTIVFIHGLLMNATLWSDVVAALQDDFRCIVPTLPLGAHTNPMNADADLSLAGIAGVVTEFLDRLDLSDVTVVGNDTGGAIAQLLAAANRANARITSLVLVSCEAFDNVPPGLTGKAVVAIGRLPRPLFTLVMQQMRLRPMRRLPIAFGWLTKRGDRVTAGWMRSLLSHPDIRRDAIKVLRGIAKHRDVLVDASPQLSSFPHPTLIIWAKGDRVMPPEHGRRLAELFPQSEHHEIDDTYTLVPLDQPAALAEHLTRFVSALTVPV